jgi:hypothetical protein
MVKAHASGLKKGKVMGAKANKTRSQVANARYRAKKAAK